LGSPRQINNERGLLAYLYDLEPRGYIVVAADDLLPPVMAYSLTSPYANGQDSILEELLCADLASRLDQAASFSTSQVQYQKNKWLEAQNPISGRNEEQWPPEGYSTTGGWLKTNWDQSAPYNLMCPMDPVTNARSIAGCPAVAISQIINYHETINGTVLGDEDDYHHNYAGRNYWIDDDYETLEFPSFEDLNLELDSLMYNYRYQYPPTAENIAALIFATGVAAQQVYTSSASGTFAVAQAYSAMERFGFDGCELITNQDQELLNRMAQNIMDAMPVLLAVVTPAWDAGHNLVVDGYRTDGFFHLNFGWSGSYNGWYNLFSGIPYNLTVLEGAVLDILPREYFYAFPEVVEFLTVDTAVPQTIEMINTSGDSVAIESLNMPFLGTSFTVSSNPQVPCQLDAGQSLYITLCPDLPVLQPREILEGNLRIIHEYGVTNILIRFDTGLITPVEDENISPLQKLSPGIFCYIPILPRPETSSLSGLAVQGIKLWKVQTSEYIISEDKSSFSKAYATRNSPGELWIFLFPHCPRGIFHQTAIHREGTGQEEGIGNKVNLIREKSCQPGKRIG
jgi:hypothetical protein